MHVCECARVSGTCSFLGLFPFTAPYLPWVLLGFSMLLGSGGVIVDAIGIAVGHVYFFLEDIVPQVAESRRWSFRKPLSTPTILYVRGRHAWRVMALPLRGWTRAAMPSLLSIDNSSDHHVTVVIARTVYRVLPCEPVSCMWVALLPGNLHLPLPVAAQAHVVRHTA